MSKLKKYIVNAEANEVFKTPNGEIKKVSENAPIHDDDVLTNSNKVLKKTSNNNGGVLISAESVLSATHENRNTNDESYTEIDEIIKVKPKELDEYAKMLGIKKINNNKSVSPSKAFELLKNNRDKQYEKFLNFKTNDFSDDYQKQSEKLNLIQAQSLPVDDDLYEFMLSVQELKKLNAIKNAKL